MDSTPIAPSADSVNSVTSLEENLLERMNSDERLRAVVGTGAEGIIVIDEKGIITSMNPAAEKMFGYREAEVIGMNLSALTPSPNRENHDGYIAEYFRTAIPEVVEAGRYLEGVRKDGARFAMHLRVAELRISGQRYFTGFITDQTARRNAESALHDERNLLSAILDTIAALVVVIDSEGRIIRFNRACEELTGYSFDEVQGLHFWDLLLAPEEKSAVQMVFRLLLTEAKPNIYENLWIAKDGSARRIAWRNTVLVDAKGIVTHVIGTGIDVTDRRNAEAGERELTTRFVATFENAAVGIAHVSPDGRWLRVNEKLCEITGYPREELLTKRFSDITHPADIEADWKQVLGLLRGQISSYSTEKRYVHKNGSIVWMSETVSLVSSSTGQPEYFITVIHDITRPKQAQLALRDNEEHLRRVLDNLYVFVGVLSPDGTLLHVSKPPLDAAGITWEEVRGLKFWDCFWWLHSPAAQHKVKKAVEKAGLGTPSRYDTEVRIAGDQRLIMDFMLSPMRNDDGQITHLIASAVDITSRKELEREVLEISDREQRRIGQDLHDDLCQRLTATEFLAQSLASDMSSEWPTYAARIRKISEYIRGSISHTRLLARGLSPVRMIEDGLVTALRELANSTEELFNVRCTFSSCPSITLTNQDSGSQIYRIAQEAISNAIRHGRATEIEIRLEPWNEQLRVVIADNGCGISKTQPRSDGMGLRIMKHRAEIISATLDVRPGKLVGTEVVCTFPP